MFMKDSKQKIEKYHLHKAHPEKLQFQVYDLKSYRKKSGLKAAVPHSHSYYQVIWFFDAGGSHIVDFECLDIKKNTVLFINKDQIHAFDENLNTPGWLIHFNESFFMHSDVDMFLKYHLFNTGQSSCYEMDHKMAYVGSTYISLMQQELEQPNNFGSEDVMRYLLKSFLINLERIRRAETKNKIELTNTYELQYYTFKDLLEAHYNQCTSVQAYAEAMHISSKTLANITKNQVGKSPSQLIADRIILEAKRLLQFTSLQISEVLYRLGFEDASYFVKYFKRHVGVSPSDYRAKKYQGNSF